MKKYTIGLITGALLAISAMMFIGAQNKNLGEITVEKITLRKEGGKKMCVIQGDGLIVIDETAITSIFSGKVLTFNADGKETVYLGTGQDGSGVLTTSDADGKRTAYLGTGEGGSGKLQTYNKHEVITGYFGSNKDNDGMAFLKDRYGDIGWSARGKK